MKVEWGNKSQRAGTYTNRQMFVRVSALGSLAIRSSDGVISTFVRAGAWNWFTVSPDSGYRDVVVGMAASVE